MTPAPTPARTAQTLRLSLEDQARALRFHLQHGARWLVRDLRTGVGVLEQLRAPGSAQLPRLQHFVETAAEATGHVLQTAGQAAATVAAPDAAYRNLRFRLQPLASYLGGAGSDEESRVFTRVFYWLIRHALDSTPGSGLLVRQRLLDEAYWRVVKRDPATTTPGAASTPWRDAHGATHNVALCAQLLEALVHAQPVYDANLPPWAQRTLHEPSATIALASLLKAVLATGLAAVHPPSDAAQALNLASRLVEARQPELTKAARSTDAREALGAELAFVLRHT